MSLSYSSFIKTISIGNTVIANDVSVASTFFERGRGLMFSDPIENGQALLFDFSRTTYRGVHTFGVRQPIDVIWVNDGEVTTIKTLKPWTGVWIGKADMIIEIPADQDFDISVGDPVSINSSN